MFDVQCTAGSCESQGLTIELTDCVPLLQANGVCQSSRMDGTCQLQPPPANCTAATSPEDKALCELVATVKSVPSIQGGVKAIADNFCASEWTFRRGISVRALNQQPPALQQ